ncbi:MucR family transcriptional regulator [Lichenihabitans psoromatis]|uniref:MucR family transcriptional regulator n=1 Tax=Lichenihabitans psoromatis TaxID=2528642 RepID=UPI001FE0D2D3|nr:MucR family transcriptional regulator [Lichenihabitans psoromatis]
MADTGHTLEMTVDSVAAFVSNDVGRVSAFPELIEIVHSSLVGVMSLKEEVSEVQVAGPAVPITKSVTNDNLVCLEHGKRFKSLKRHLQTAFGLIIDLDRAEWGLPCDYPMVSHGYAAIRSELAKGNGLGNSRRKTAVALQKAAAHALATDAQVAEPLAKRRGRPAKKAVCRPSDRRLGDGHIA